jgi:hypothetical protein
MRLNPRTVGYLCCSISGFGPDGRVVLTNNVSDRTEWSMLSVVIQISPFYPTKVMIARQILPQANKDVV